MKYTKYILKYTGIAAALLIVLFQHSMAQKQYSSDGITFTNGERVYIVPLESAPQVLDALFRSAAVDHRDYHLLVQVGTFAVKDNAFRLRQRLEREGYKVNVREYHAKEMLYYLVYVGSYVTLNEAHETLRNIKTTYNLDGMLLAQGKTKQ